MADLAIGISKTVVQELAKKVKNAKEEEAKQWKTLERDIVFMKHEFEMMQSFLASADGEGRFRAAVARTWVRQVRELSDGAEDCIDYVLHLDTERSPRTLCLRVLPSCMRGAPVLPLDKAVSDIEQLKAMVEDVSKRNMRYSGLGSGDYSGSKQVPPVAGRMHLGSSAASASTLLDIFVKPSEAAKDKDAAECLMNLVAAADDANLRIFCVCGTGGDLGTVSIVRRVLYEDPEFCSQFPLLAWVNLTQPFDPLGFVGSLVDQFEANSRRLGKHETIVVERQPRAAKFVQDITKMEMKYLIVLEDVRSMAGWDAARAFLPDTNNGSRVIVLTHQLEIASLCTGSSRYQVSLLRQFSPHHSLYVFYQEVQEQQAQASKFKPTAVTMEAQASGEQQAKPTATEITEEKASGKQQAKPTAVEIRKAPSSSSEPQAKSTAAEITEAQASDDRLRSHCSEDFRSQVEKLVELIRCSRDEHRSHRVISVCAAKSSVVKTVYNRCLRENWFDDYAWVEVPPPRLNMEEFYRRLYWFMDGGSGSRRDSNDENIEYISRMKARLLFGENLIFIDGLQSGDDWNSITTELPFSECRGCCTVVVTKDENVAQHCASDQSLVCNISDQGDIAPHNLQYQHDDDDDSNYLIRPKGSSRLAMAYDWLRDNPLVGRDSREEEKLEELITSRHCHMGGHVISVCGIAGAGKSFIVRTMYYRCIQREVREDLFGGYVWVDVPDPFDITEFCRRLFLAAKGKSNKNMAATNFVEKCSNLMRNWRVLLVIDGLRTTDDWDSIQANLRLAASATCCIVVVTRDPTVAKHCANPKDEICSITSLQEDAIRHLLIDKITQLLCEVAPAGTSGQEDPKMTKQELDMLIKQALAIMNKCGRSPEALGALLRYYLVSKQGAVEIGALRHLNDNFMKELRANPDLGGLQTVFTSMHSSIQACPQVIKKCIFYLSIFPQGSSIRRDRLVRRWIAEGYSEGIESISIAVYTETKLFHKLAELGMITKPPAAQSSTGAAVNNSGTMRMSSCQVNSLFMEYITLRETEESIFLPLEVTVLEGGCSPPKTQHVGQHLAIRDWEGEKAVFDCLDLTRLRSLTVSGQWQPFFVSDMMLVLRVLDLEGTTSNLSDGDLKQIVKQLPRLKFISLRGCKEITRLPRSVGDLRQLQSLDVRGTKIVRLPGSIVKLQKLQYLRAGADDGQGGGVRVPGGIGALKALHTLGAIDLSSSCTGVAILNKLHRLPQLRKLHVSGIKRQHNSLCVCVACCVSDGQASSGSSIRFPTNSFGELKVLEITCSPGMHVQFDQGAVPKLEKLKLYNGPSPQISGLEFLTSSLKQILCKGPGCNAVRDTLASQLNRQIPNNQIALTAAQECLVM